MKNLIKHKIFIAAFLLSYFSFFVITIFILDIKREGFGVGFLEYGFPFSYYYLTCFSAYYSWAGLVGNILFAAILGIVVGVISTHLWLKFLMPLLQKVTSPEFRAKWYL